MGGWDESREWKGGEGKTIMITIRRPFFGKRRAWAARPPPSFPFFVPGMHCPPLQPPYSLLCKNFIVPTVWLAAPGTALGQRTTCGKAKGKEPKIPPILYAALCVCTLRQKTKRYSRPVCTSFYVCCFMYTVSSI